mgnify:FL=1
MNELPLSLLEQLIRSPPGTGCGGSGGAAAHLMKPGQRQGCPMKK